MTAPTRDEAVDQARPYLDAGVDEVYAANMGPHDVEMIAAYGREMLPELRSHASA